MLRTLTLSLLGLLATSTLHAQDVRLGVKAGLNASAYQGDDVPSSRLRLGPAAGILVRLPLGTHLDLQPELLYEQRVVRTEQTIDGPYGYYSHSVRRHEQTKSRLQYLALPVLARLHWGKFFAVGGPQLSYLVGARQQVKTEIEDIFINDPLYDPLPFSPSTSTVQRRGTDAYHRWELGYVIGFGYQATARLGVELRYAAGLTQVGRQLVYATVYLAPVQSALTRNSTLQAQVSYQLGKL
ncbi:MAG TPA: porin family protein [Hymenobacter sp.]|jgi:hypothetical protein